MIYKEKVNVGMDAIHVMSSNSGVFPYFFILLLSDVDFTQFLYTDGMLVLKTAGRDRE